MSRILRNILAVTTIFFFVPIATGCARYSILAPKGPIGHDERFLILISVALMLIVVVPVIVMSIWFPIKYRAGNPRARYEPRWSNSRRIEAVVWLVPMAIVASLSLFIWKYTHKLDPYKPIAAMVSPIAIEAISLDWKWLFIYPDEHVAAVNQIAFPLNTPVTFRITSATVMTSLFIPQLGSQMYAMAGMQTRLNLLASKAGAYAGQNQQYSGRGYPGMFFTARATSWQDYEEWLKKIRQSSDTLSWARYRTLAHPSIADSVVFFSAVEPGLFDSVICTFNPEMRFMMKCTHEQPALDCRSSR